MKPFFSAVSVLALCTAAPALADITAAEVLAEWEADMAAMGSGVTMNSRETSDGVVIESMQIVVPTIDGGEMTTTYGEMRLIDQRDGTVAYEIANPFAFSTAGIVEGEELRVDGEMALEGYEAIISGDPNNYTLSARADRAVMTLTDMVMPEADEMPDMDFDMVMSGLQSAFTVAGERGARRMSGAGSMSGFDVNMDFSEEGEKGVGGSTGVFELSIASAEMALEGDYDGMLTWSAAAAAGPEATADLPLYDMSMDATYSSATFRVDFADGSEDFAASGQNTGGAFAFSIGDTMVYDLSAQNATLSVSGAEIPFPIDIAAERTGFAMTIPMVAQPDPSDIALSIDYAGVTIGDQLWGMFDPGAAIPRDPATVRLDMTGTVQMLANLAGMDPMQFRGPPGDMRSLSLNELLVSAAGATLTGNGAVEFEPGSFPPSPVGQVNIALEGFNALTSSLVAAGLVPAEQVAMGTAMLGMFARPGAGADTLESTIDFTPGGGISANGVPLR